MTVFFVFKRVVGMVTRPLPVVFILLLLGLVISLAFKRKRLGRLCYWLAAILMVLVSLPPIARGLAGRLERRSAPLLAAGGGMDPYAVVVLGNGVAFPGDSAMPALTRLNDTARARLVEGVRLSLVFPDARLLTSGSGLGLENCADAMAEAAVELGVARERIHPLVDSMDTEHEADLVARLAGGRQVVVVTSAVHMPRALHWFSQAGVDAIPAPCDYVAPVSESVLRDINRYRWRPQGKTISDHEALWHEVLGLLYQRWFGSGGEVDDDNAN
ncbi:MAG: YdcF family protein [Planctomycetes bacterium]|nr:YdcF family protein [Planctomycetota bacterium]